MEYRILHLEDLPSDVALAEREIKKILSNYSLCVVETEDDFIKELEGFKPHIVISDFQLPSFNGLSALKIVLQKTPITPVIMLTGSMNEDTAVDCMKAGASDYVIKEHIKRLGPAILNALEQKEIKSEKAKAEQKILLLSRSIEQSPVSVLITDPTGNIEYINQKFSELTGYSFDEALGQNPRLLKSGKQPEDFYKKMWQTISTGAEWRGEMHNKRKNGELYWESVSISSIANAKGEILHYIGVKEDVTEKKQIVEDLIVAKSKAEESDMLKTSFLQNISHEIRTPLNAIVGFSEILTDPLLPTDKRQHFNNIIGQSSKQLLSIISDIISISTIEAGQGNLTEKFCNVNSKCKLIYEQFASKAKELNISFNCDLSLSDSEATVLIDENKFLQVLSNLLENAFKFTTRGHVHFGYSLKENYLEFYIKDTGIGIPSDMFQEIFKPFRQVENNAKRRYGGSGLGLSISKANVELLGGKIWLASENEKGSVFYFTIPFNKEKQDINIDTQVIDKIRIENAKPKTILIAEDEDFNFMYIEELLSEVNYKILRANNGVEAIEICKSSPPDLVLIDLKMPVLDGYKATSQIREFMPDLPIIAQTAYSSDAERSRALAGGCNDFISKPFSPEALLSIINKHLPQ